MISYDDYKDKIFGYLKPVGPEFIERHFNKKKDSVRKSTTIRMVYCDCLNCGRKNVPIPVFKMLYGDRVSCGCILKQNRMTLGEKIKSGEITIKKDIIHGDSIKSSEYNKLFKIWVGMKYRCYDKNSRDYKNYGGRGIIICDEWLNEYVKFKEWALSIGYIPNAGLTIERKDVNGNYCPGNCTFANRDQQSNNKRNNHPITLYGETYNITQWSRIIGFELGTIYQKSKAHNNTLEEEIDSTINPIPDLIKPIIFIDENKIYKNGKPDIECK